MLARPKITEIQADTLPVQVRPGLPPEMVSEYVQRCLTAVPAARAALDQHDYGHLRVLGHRLKGSGGGYGIYRLTEIGSAIEAAAVRDDGAELRRQVGVLDEYLHGIEILP
jgi:hypothetical protein